MYRSKTPPCFILLCFLYFGDLARASETLGLISTPQLRDKLLRSPRKSNIETVASEFSDEDATAGVQRTQDSRKHLGSILSATHPTLQMRMVSGNVQFVYKSEDKSIQSVVVCGSWSGWKRRHAMSMDTQEECWICSIDEVPEGRQHFKVQPLDST
jgi:hypothetical protein